MEYEKHYESRLHFTIIIQVQFSSEILYVVIKVNCTKTCIFYTKFQMEIRYSNFFLAKFQREIRYSDILIQNHSKTRTRACVVLLFKYADYK
jgi:hypothetical protein